MKSRHGERLHALRITSRFCWQGVCLRSLCAVCPSAHAHNHATWQTKGACQPKHPGWGGRWTWCPTWPPPWERWAVQAPCSCDANAESCEAAWPLTLARAQHGATHCKAAWVQPLLAAGLPPNFVLCVFLLVLLTNITQRRDLDALELFAGDRSCTLGLRRPRAQQWTLTLEI